MPKITCLVEGYHSNDPWDEEKPGRSIDLAEGQETTVSAKKADQLERDFPDWFEIEGRKKPKRSRAKAEPEPDAGEGEEPEA